MWEMWCLLGGLKPDPEKVRAITEYPKPENKQDLQRFLGMVNYLGQFIANLSGRTAPLRLILKKDIEWHWCKEQDDAYQDVKQALITAPTLKFFDVQSAVVIQADASKAGLGACLMQEGHPVAYASRALPEAEQNYAQIEKELLAIVFACEKFNQYVYGKAVVVESDHKPLEMISKKNLSKASPRLQRMLLRLFKYSVDIVYKPGPQMHISDALSRASIQDDSIDKGLVVDIEVMVHNISSKLFP